MVNKFVSPSNMGIVVTNLLLKVKKDLDNSRISKVSQLNNDSKFLNEIQVESKINIGVEVAKSYAQDLVNAGAHLFEFVPRLPINNINPKSIYFVPKSLTDTNNIYDEYVYSNYKWEKIGDTNIDLSGYYKSNEVDDIFLLADANMDEKISDYNKIITDKFNQLGLDYSNIMDKETYISKVYPDTIKKAVVSIKLEGVESSPTFSYYGKDRNGDIGYHLFPITTEPNLNNFQTSISNVEVGKYYYIDLLSERTLSDLICQAYKFVEGDKNVDSILKTFNSDESYNNIYNNDNITFEEGLRINKVHQLTLTTNSDGFFESDILKKSDYIEIREII